MMGLANLIPGVGQAKAVVGSVVVGIIAALVIGLLITRHTLSSVRAWQDDVEQAAREATHEPKLERRFVAKEIRAMGAALDQVEIASAKAKTDNAANNTRIGTAQEAVAKETGDAIDQQIAAARAAGAADYARRMRGSCPSVRSGAGELATPTAGGPAVAADGPGGMPVMDADDVRVCSDNTVKALGWQRWNDGVSAIPR